MWGLFLLSSWLRAGHSFSLRLLWRQYIMAYVLQTIHSVLCIVDCTWWHGVHLSHLSLTFPIWTSRTITSFLEGSCCFNLGAWFGHKPQMKAFSGSHFQPQDSDLHLPLKLYELEVLVSIWLMALLPGLCKLPSPCTGGIWWAEQSSKVQNVIMVLVVTDLGVLPVSWVHIEHCPQISVKST